MLECNNIYHGDCLELMSDISDETIDLILCDLPYGVLNKNNPHAQWDNVIPFDKLWEQYCRIIKKNGVIVLFGQGMFTAQLITSAPNGMYRYNIVWVKDQKTGFLDANRRPLRQHEDIMVFSKVGKHTYNPQMVKVDWHRRHSQNSGIMKCQCYGNGSIKALKSEMVNDNYPSTVIYFPKANGKGFNHPTEKPVDLLRYLIKTYSNENDVVLDNTMGSGSTCVAAIIERRRYIGIELSLNYFEIAKKRIEKELMQQRLF